MSAERWMQAMCPEHDARLTMSNQGGWMCSSPTCHIVREPTWIEIVQAEHLAGAVARADRFAAELQSIADADPVDLALDPTWSQRVAREALTGRRTS